MRKYFKGKLSGSVFIGTMSLFFFLFLALFVILYISGNILLPKVKEPWLFFPILTFSVFFILFFTTRMRNRYYQNGVYAQSKSFQIFNVTILVIYGFFVSLILYDNFRYLYRNNNYEESNSFTIRRIERETNGVLDSNKIMALVNGNFDSLYPGWKEYHSEEGHYTILIPGYPSTDITKNQIINGEKYPITQLSVNSSKYDHANLGYTVSYLVIPKIYNNCDEMLDAQKNFLISVTNSVLEFESEIDTGGFFGRELYLTVDESNLKVTTRLYCHKGIFYSLSVITPEGHLFNNSIASFLNSFRFTD